MCEFRGAQPMQRTLSGSEEGGPRAGQRGGGVCLRGACLEACTFQAGGSMTSDVLTTGQSGTVARFSGGRGRLGGSP